MNKLVGKYPWIVIVIMLVMVGCSSTPTPVSSTQVSNPIETPVLSFPVGIFTQGGWTWEFKSGGSYTSKSNSVEENGIYTVIGNQIALHGDYAPCKNIIGMYTWTYDGNNLNFTTVKDNCADRRKVVGESSWLNKP